METLEKIKAPIKKFTFRPKYPYHLVWIATNACNARCVHCSTEAAKALPNELSTEEAKNMFRELATLGVFDIAVSGGEPLVRKDIMEVLEYAADLGLKIGIGSNGSTVTKAKVKQLKEIGIDRLQISIDGTEKTHDLARRWDGLYKRSVNAIRLGVEGGMKVHVCMTLHRLNYNEVDDVIDNCLEWGVSRFNLSRFVPTGRGTKFLDLPNDIWKETIENFEERKRSLKGQMEFSTHLAQQILSDPSLSCSGGFIGCQAGIGQACIGPTGAVSPCVMLPVSVGNIRRSSFQNIWTKSEELKLLRDRNNLKGECGTCFMKEKCGGCRAVAFAYTQDILATDPRCWK